MKILYKTLAISEKTTDKKPIEITITAGQSKIYGQPDLPILYTVSDNEIVDDLVIKTKGKSVTVDGEATQIPADGEMNVSALQKADKKLIYASVDNALKYAGDTFTATRLTQINTTQISFNTKKLVADGQTGLKWVTEINKADYEKLLGW